MLMIEIVAIRWLESIFPFNLQKSDISTCKERKLIVFFCKFVFLFGFCVFLLKPGQNQEFARNPIKRCKNPRKLQTIYFLSFIEANCRSNAAAANTRKLPFNFQKRGISPFLHSCFNGLDLDLSVSFSNSECCESSLSVSPIAFDVTRWDCDGMMIIVKLKWNRIMKGNQ